MEVRQRRPLEGGQEQICAGPGEAEPSAACEPEDRQRSERQRGRLEEQHRLRARPECEDGEDRIEVRAEPDELLPLGARLLERPAFACRPGGLDHVPEIEAAGLERPMLQQRQRREKRRPGADQPPEQASQSDSSSLRQRAPSTSSLALAR
jgi:hypothetical protein